MFGFLLSQAARARRDARNWIEVADKVINFRRDQLADGDLNELQQRRNELKAAVKAKDDAAKIKLGIGALEPVLHRCGGSVYPKTSTADNVEFFLSAAIVILGIKAFFLQPFKIPTNSMWPTYFGMKHEVWTDPKTAPGLLGKGVRLAMFGATRVEVTAPTDGELVIPFGSNHGRICVPFSTVEGRKWLVVPTPVKEYVLLVGNEAVKVQVPADFDLETAISETFFGSKTGSADGLVSGYRAASTNSKGNWARIRTTVNGETSEGNNVLLRTGRQFKRGEVAFSFDVLSGDQLVVDRVSNHFLPPRVGEGFVFRTGRIPGIGSDQYYVKRLAGVPGDKLEIREPVLFRNGSPIEGGLGFAMNAKRAGLYRGYAAMGQLSPGVVWEVPEDSFVALGDNSYNSADSRYWGFVPAADAIGRPLFIYYPFTSRWGLAK